MRAAIELIDDLEDRLLAFLRRCVRGEQPADAQMGLGALRLPGSANRRLPARGRGGTCRNRPSRRRGLTARLPRDRRGMPPPSPETPSASIAISALLPRQANCCSAFWVVDGQATQLPDHQVHHVVGVPLARMRAQVPGPARLRRDRMRASPRRPVPKELDREERIAGRSSRGPVAPAGRRARGRSEASRRAAAPDRRGRGA